MNELNSIFKTSHYVQVFNRIAGEFFVYDIGFDDFDFVEEINLFRKQPYHSLHYVIEGEGVLYFRGKKYTISAGQYFVLPPHENFKYHPNKQNPWKYVWMDFDGEFAKQYFQELYHGSPVISDVPKAESKALFKNLFQELTENNSAKYYSVLSCFYGVLNRLTQDVVTKAEKLPYVHNAKRFMEQNFQSPEFNVDVLCKMIHISHSYLCKLFQRQEGTTIKAYLNALRMDEAGKLLRGSDMHVKEIAFQVGFFDEINFMKAFKKYYGKTPSEYRR